MSTRKIATITLTAVVVVAMLAMLVPFGTGGGQPDAPTATGSPAPGVGVDPSPGEPQTDTIERGSAPVMGEGTSVLVDDLSQACAEAVAPIRELTAVFASGLELDDDGSAELSTAVRDARAECSSDEFGRYVEQELTPWMNAEPADGTSGESADEQPSPDESGSDADGR